MKIDWHEFRLRNGLRVIFAPDPSRPVAAVNLWYRVGSRNERPGRTGFAHLFEHMMFQGSLHVPDTQHFAYLEGAGGAANGSTWFDRTNYYETVPSHHLELALWLEADRMGYLLPAMTQEKLDNQRDVVKNERRQRVDNQPYGDWDERLQALVFPSDHPYHHPVIGSMADLDAATLQDVQEFFRTFYAPNNAVLSVCGDFEPSTARALVEHHFGEIPAGPVPPPVPGATAIPHRLMGETREEVIADVALPRCYLAFRTPPYGNPSFYAGEVAAHILASGRASRLYRSAVRETRLAQDVAGFCYPLVTGAAMAVFWATAAPERSLDALEAALDAEMRALAEHSPSREEVARAVTRIAARQTFGLQSVAERADQLSMFATLFDDPDRINTELDRYRAVEPEAVRAFAADFLAQESRVVLRYQPRATRAVQA